LNFLGKILNLEHKASANRIAFNTVIIYIQKVASAALAIVTTPIILNVLGVEDYGLYTLIVGVVGMLAFLNWSLTIGTQRFISYALGEGNPDKLKRIFSNAMVIHLTYALLLLLIISIGGTYFIDSLLDIPAGRTETAKLLLILMSFISFISIISVPFSGVFQAHENFTIVSVLGVIDSVLKLGIAVLLMFVGTDKLIVYMLMLMASSLIVFLLNVTFCRKLYAETRFNLRLFDWHQSREMLLFMGWSILGSLAVISRNQGVSVLINIFFGVVKNAAYGIAMQVNAGLNVLSNGIKSSMSPQILKSAGTGDYNKMIYLMRSLSKFSLLIVCFVSIPFLFEAPLILKIWLKTVPADTVLFSRLIVIYSMTMMLSAGIQTVFSAIGKVKLYNLYVSVLLIMNLPVSYFLFKAGFASYTILEVGIILELISLVIRLFLLKKYVNFSIGTFVMDVIVKMGFPILLCAGIVMLVRYAGMTASLQLIATIGIVLTIYPLTVYRFSLDKGQQEYFMRALTGALRKIKAVKS